MNANMVDEEVDAKTAEEVVYANTVATAHYLDESCKMVESF